MAKTAYLYPSLESTISLRSTCSVPGSGAGACSLPLCGAFLARAVAQARQVHTEVAEERFLGASCVVCAMARILSMPAWLRRWSSSAACAAESLSS